ncbi:hypothetical protein HWV62_1294, partial [Athelia sp. TMB]
MFQQPLKLKTSVHLQPYDRRLLKQRVLRAFPGIGEVELVPTELMLAKFRTHLNERGIAWLSEWKVVYLGPNGDPLWFTVGQDSEEIIPTVYTLWKKPDLLPTLTTFSEEIPALTVAHRKQVIEIPATPPLQPDQLVAIAQDYSARGAPKAGPPLVVGRMAVSGEELRVLVQGQGKYKKKHAVAVVHTCRDSLWEIGTDASVPEPRDISNAEAESEGEDIASLHGEATAEATPEEVTSILRTALLQSISTSFLTLPPGTFPIPAVVFYTTHILPFRPAHVSFITPIDIKCSSHKSLTTFLKAAEKEGLLQLKERRMHKHMELLVVDVDPKHHDVAAHHVYITLKDVEGKRAAKEVKTEKKAKKVKEMKIEEYQKASEKAVAFVEAAGGDASSLYTMPELEGLISGYIASQSLTNEHNQAFVDVDELLRSTIAWEQQDHKTEDI